MIEIQVIFYILIAIASSIGAITMEDKINVETKFEEIIAIPSIIGLIILVMGIPISFLDFNINSGDELPSEKVVNFFELLITNFLEVLIYVFIGFLSALLTSIAKSIIGELFS